MSKGEQNFPPDEAGGKGAVKSGFPGLLGTILATVIFFLTIRLTTAFISKNVFVVVAILAVVVATLLLFFRLIFSKRDS